MLTDAEILKLAADHCHSLNLSHTEFDFTDESVLVFVRAVIVLDASGRPTIGSMAMCEQLMKALDSRGKHIEALNLVIKRLQTDIDMISAIQ